MADPQIDLHVEGDDQMSAQLLRVAEAADLQLLAAGGRVRYRVGVEEWTELPTGEALDRERAGHCDHDTIWYDDPDDVTRCAACHDPIPPGTRP